MSDIAVFIDSETGNAICEWCSANYVRTVHNGKYCSVDCRLEVARANAVGRYQTEYPTTKLEPRGLFYQDYINENSRAIEKYGVKPPTPKESNGGTTYKVPDLNFKRFKETKKVLIIGQKAEIERNGWV